MKAADDIQPLEKYPEKGIPKRYPEKVFPSIDFPPGEGYISATQVGARWLPQPARRRLGS
jgi:hypothetical protein